MGVSFGGGDGFVSGHTTSRQKTQEELLQDAQRSFQHAVVRRDKDAVMAAIENGAEPNATFYQHYTIPCDYDLAYPQTRTVAYANALHYLIRTETEDVNFVGFLIESGVDVNTEQDNKTTLHHALENQNMEWIKILLGSRAVDITNDIYQSAIEAATQNQNKGRVEQDIYNALRKAYVAVDPWEKVDNDTISHTHFQNNDELEIVDSFNFAAGERFRLVRDHKLACVSAETLYFADMPQQALFQLKHAWKRLQKMNNKPETTPIPTTVHRCNTVNRRHYRHRHS